MKTRFQTTAWQIFVVIAGTCVANTSATATDNSSIGGAIALQCLLTIPSNMPDHDKLYNNCVRKNVERYLAAKKAREAAIRREYGDAPRPPAAETPKGAVEPPRPSPTRAVEAPKTPRPRLNVGDAFTYHNANLLLLPMSASMVRSDRGYNVFPGCKAVILSIHKDGSGTDDFYNIKLDCPSSMWGSVNARGWVAARVFNAQRSSMKQVTSQAAAPPLQREASLKPVDRAAVAELLRNADTIWDEWSAKCPEGSLQPGSSCRLVWMKVAGFYLRASHEGAIPADRSPEIQSRIELACGRLRSVNLPCKEWSL